MRTYLLLLTLVSTFFSLGQTNFLTHEDFIAQVMENHPVSYQAEIVQSIGENTVVQSKGGFDPKLFGNFNQKYFDDKQYYSRFKAGIKIPTWFGLSAEAGYTNNNGVFLNPENRLPNSGLWYAGLRLDLGNGLIMNQRRAEFEKAKIQAENSVIDRKIVLNELRRDASIAYFKWLEKYQKVQVYRKALENATNRKKATVESVLFGDRAEVDTLEASLTVQRWEIQRINQENELENAELKLELYLWVEGYVPLEIENTIPTTEGLVTVKQSLKSMDSLVLNHPFILSNELNLQQKRIDLKLKREQWKPKATLKYNALLEPINNNPFSDYNISNYTWGAELSYPILSRKARGSVRIAKLKIQDQEMKNKLLNQKVAVEIQTKMNSYQNSLEQIELRNKLVENYQTLYSAEQTLFNLGESSIFMINSRESSWLKSQLDLIETERTSRELKAELDFSMMRF